MIMSIEFYKLFKKSY